jgi:hypothetical protein
VATPHATAPRRHTRDRITHVIAAIATVMGLWFGMTAPSVSPVAAPPPAAVSQTVTTNVTTNTVPPQDLPGGGGR